MVRLKALEFERIEEIVFTFQFLHGAIKSMRKNLLMIIVLNFNSYMVRLKATSADYKGGGYDEFQFLHGAIKSKYC